MSRKIKIENNIEKYIQDFEYKGLSNIEGRLTSIVILTYNQLEYTKLCIESIRKFTKKSEYEIIVVDNKSTDGTIEWLNQQEDINIIFNDENKGFPAGCNQGISVAKGDNILLLNNDVIVTPNWLYNLDKALWSSDDIGAVGAVSNSCSYYQQIDVTYDNINEMLRFAEKYNKSDENYWSYRTKLIGFCMMIKKEVIDKVGLLDERFTPGNFEDDDISFRMICEGYKLLLCKDTFIHHFGSISFSKNDKFREILQTNIKKFVDKWKFNPIYSNNIRFDIINMIENNREESLNILEIGCGLGATLLEVKNRYKNANIYGVEICDNAVKVSKNTCNAIVGNVEEIDLPYENKFFDYIILGDILEHLNNPWMILKNIKKYLSKSGYIIASIPNVMHASVITDLVKGKFSYQEAGILDRTHLRFFTLSEIEKLFKANSYSISKVNSVYVPLTDEEEKFVNYMCEKYGQELKDQYESYQYLIKANKGIDYDRYNSDELIALKHKLMRIDNELDIEESINYIEKLINNYDDELIDDLEYLIEFSVINKEKTLNRIAIEFFRKGIYEFSISILMLALKINRNCSDTVYNLSYLLNQIGEYNVSLSILKNSSDEVKNDIGIQNIIKITEEKVYEQ